MFRCARFSLRVSQPALFANRGPACARAIALLASHDGSVDNEGTPRRALQATPLALPLSAVRVYAGFTPLGPPPPRQPPRRRLRQRHRPLHPPHRLPARHLQRVRREAGFRV